MNRGAARQAIFRGDRDRFDFGELLGDAVHRYGIEVHAYCLMPNHFHLLVRCPEGGLSAAMQHLSSRYTRRVNDRAGTDGPLMRGRFTSKPIPDHDYLVAAFRYIHLNPEPIVRPGRLLDYRWSSLRAYLGYRRPPSWLSVSRFTSWFGLDGITDLMMITDRELHIESLWSLADVALDEAGIEGAGTVRTAMLLVAEAMPDRARDITERLGFADDRALRRAQLRARRRADDRPELGAVVAALRRLAA